MLKANRSRYPSIGAHTGPGRRSGRPAWSPMALALALVAGSILVSTVLLVIAGVTAWRWTDQHLLHVGFTTSKTTTVNRTELVRQIRAFQLITVKQTYATRTQQSISQTFSVGTSRMSLPVWLAGEQMTVQGQVQVLAGVDLAQVGPNDIVVRESGTHRAVQVTIPRAEVLSTELVPNTLRVSTTAGVLPQLEQALGISDDQLRDRAADLLLQAGREAAEQQGIEASAAAEAQQQLADFLQTLPSDGGRVTYAVAVQQTSRP